MSKQLSFNNNIIPDFSNLYNVDITSGRLLNNILMDVSCMMCVLVCVQYMFSENTFWEAVKKIYSLKPYIVYRLGNIDDGWGEGGGDCGRGATRRHCI